MPDNVLGTWSVFEAAVRAAVPRVVFASTVQTMLGEANGTLRPAEPPRPISVYACSKLFGEAVARYHADVHGLQVACLRIGWVVPPDSRLFRVEADLPNLWCAPADLLALILAALQSPVRFATVVVVSPPATGRFDVANPYGWRPNELPAVRRGRWASIRSVRVARRIRRRPGSGP
jgi:uronate dehydrogenase